MLNHFYFMIFINILLLKIAKLTFRPLGTKKKICPFTEFSGDVSFRNIHIRNEANIPG